MGMSFAYLSAGRVHLKQGDEPLRSVESHYARQARERAVRIHERNAWKSAGSGARFMSGGLLWGRAGQQEVVLNTRITGLARGCAPGELVYALDTSEVGGVFLLREAGEQEQRLFHTSDFRVSDVSVRDDRKMMACVVRYRDGTSNIAVMHSDGSALTEVTQGDAIDQAPRWVPGSENELVFQSAGIGRNAEGLAMGQAPFVIHKVDIERGNITCLAEDAGRDLLAPQFAADGTLYYIRRPYKGQGERPNLFRALKDMLLFPFRLLHALFQYLNFFTVAYTGKPLTSAGGAQQRSADVRQMMIWGNLISADNAAREKGDDGSGLVPDSWQLVRQSPNGSPDVLAKGVLSFDLCRDGSLLYSDGTGIYSLDAQGKRTRLHQDKLIEHVVACD